MSKQDFPQVLRTHGGAFQNLMGGGLESIHEGSMFVNINFGYIKTFTTSILATIL